MKQLYFAKRNVLELLRDPLTISFGAAFPVLLLVLLSAINRNVPQDIMPIETLAPGIAVFGLSFFSLFSGMLISKDRSTSFLTRLYASPLSAADFILGYTLPLLPLVLLQGALCYGTALCLGLPWSLRVLWALLAELPVSVFFIALGLLCGSILNDKQVGGLCGAMLTNVCVLTSGAWFSLDLVGKGFRVFAYCLPFAHAVDIGKVILTPDGTSPAAHFAVVCGYAAAVLLGAVFAFRRCTIRS